MKTVPDFPLSLAIIDIIPVAFFFAATLIISLRLKSPLFFTGAALTFLAGSCQVIWKSLIALNGTNIWPLHAQMKYVMPLGFLLMAIAVFLAHKTIGWKFILQSLISFPQLTFVILAVICCISMIILSFALGIKDIKSQWIEEGVNILFQGSVFALVLLTTVR